MRNKRDEYKLRQQKEMIDRFVKEESKKTVKRTAEKNVKTKGNE